MKSPQPCSGYTAGIKRTPGSEKETASGLWLSQSPVPKLFIRAIPGTQDPQKAAFNHMWPTQTEVSVRGHHTSQEDSPDEIGQAIASWLQQLQ